MNDENKDILFTEGISDLEWESEQSGDGWDGRIHGYVPVQGNGTIDGLPWYFRARWDSWSLSISEDADTDPIEVRWRNASGWYYEDTWGEMFEAGWMPFETAWEIIIECFEKYRRNEGFTTPP